MTQPKVFYTVQDILNAECMLEPIICVHCDHIGEVTFLHHVGDGQCGMCGKWQMGDKIVKTLKRKCIIEIEWHRVDGKDIDPDHIVALEESATRVVIEKCAGDCFTEGELFDEIFEDDDSVTGTAYRGWWTVKT
jgi:hypothetical protein